MAAGRRLQARQGIEFDPRDPNAKRLDTRVMTAYYALFDDPSLRDASGNIESDAFEKAKRKLTATFPWEEQAEANNIIARNTNLRPIPYNLLPGLAKDEMRSILRSQEARKMYFRRIGRPELFDQWWNRWFFMLDQSPTGVPANAR